jgi:hypothetical protein
MRWSIVWLSILVGCSGESSSEGGAGPPEVLQVLVRERGDEGVVARLAYGDHDDIDVEGDDRVVDAAVARDGQRIRVVVDELLRGESLEEVACADGTWSRVPPDVTFDDVARCAGADLSGCEGICIGPDGPIGILDGNGDGAFDDTRLIDGVVTLRCDGEVVPLDPERSYYQPSGSQRLSAGSVGTDSLGPAVVLAPAAGMKPGAQCGIDLADTVVDKEGEAVCAGRGCSGGDTSAIGFTVEPFTLAWSEPAAGAADVPLTADGSEDAVITLRLNATLDATTVAGAIAITADGSSVEGATPLMADDDDATIVITVPGGFHAATTYRLTVAGGLADVWADTLGDDLTIEWETAP